MWPALRPGDVAGLVVSKRPLVGDVAVVRASGKLVAHRVVRVDGDRVVLRGDNCEADDPPVEAGLLLGRVTEVRRGARALRRDEWTATSGRVARVAMRFVRRLARIARAA